MAQKKKWCKGNKLLREITRRLRLYGHEAYLSERRTVYVKNGVCPESDLVAQFEDPAVVNATHLLPVVLVVTTNFSSIDNGNLLEFINNIYMELTASLV